ncbi:nucleotidyltransferase domain-containing protein [Virgibacillus necropolis]|uniref:Nucleotidyltransferase n=1 Tax=Virgibacillus necropolis TaxID=163877 RepID=A0A221MH52_9BACI|nr:nucleotidyltransferase domain-containing protein [Virgibacillus necropolis]ASN06960.1 nucleotidyltransferase [Virgibacillus necropolis]
MDEKKRLLPVEAAEQFVDRFFPKSLGAVLGGSVVRGEETSTSDLDIVVIDNTIKYAYRESLIEFGWPIEVFVHTMTSYKKFFEIDYKRARPSLQRMISEGVILKDTGVIELIKKEANEILDKGPEKWTEEIIRQKRYFITDALDDFIGSTNRSEQIFIVNYLAEAVHEFTLRTNGHWIGSSKWIVRALRQYDENVAEEFVEAFDAFYKNNEKEKIIKLVHTTLKPFGGRLFEGFSMGKD